LSGGALDGALVLGRRRREAAGDHCGLLVLRAPSLLARPPDPIVR